MVKILNPQHSGTARSFVTHLTNAAESFFNKKKSPIIVRYDHVYGDLSGQRALTDEDVSSYLDVPLIESPTSKHSFVLALETYFSALCNLISAAAISGNPEQYLNELAKQSSEQFKSSFQEVVSGKYHVKKGLKHYQDAFELDWFSESLNEDLAISGKALCSDIAALWGADSLFCSVTDPIQLIHDAVFPKNLMHVTGQFYTPPWLCELLVNDLQPSPDKLIIDPFCGSGAFLVTVLEYFKKLGHDPRSVMPNVLGIDLSPSACLATRTNLILFAARSGITDYSDFPINVICADSLAPAVSQGIKDQTNFFGKKNSIEIDGYTVDIDITSDETLQRVSAVLSEYGIATKKWFRSFNSSKKNLREYSDKDSVKERAVAEQLAVYMLHKADIVITNPPWVGWEYMSRPYRNYLNPAWGVYSLFEQTGLAAAFLKEDLSTLCVATACDRYLNDGGNAGLVIRPATMQSDMTARGLRRLSIFASEGSLKLKKVRDFENLKVFGNALAPAATWQLHKGEATTFPVPAIRWSRKTRKWQPDNTVPLKEVIKNVTEIPMVCTPTDEANYSSRWMIVSEQANLDKGNLSGENTLKPRIGFFTGGANAIYYMQQIGSKNASISICNNIVERAKKAVDKIQVELEKSLLYRVIRGRDIAYWNATPEVLILCPHTKETKMYPHSEPVLAKDYPYTYSYFQTMKEILKARNGFAGWEKKVHQDNYYTLQRLGEYTFAPYKVCWNYIASDFVIAVIGPDENGKPILPNDKVVFIAYDDEATAYFTAGILSSSPIRLAVVSSITARQISTTVIKHYKIPDFDNKNKLHVKISSACKAGHIAMAQKNFDLAEQYHLELDNLVATQFNLTPKQLEAFRSGLKEKLSYFPFRKQLKKKAEENLANIDICIAS